MASPNSDTTARIVRILVDCGMVASEELEIVRCLILNPAAAPERRLRQPAKPPAPSTQS